MNGIEELHVIFDASGSFCEPGKQRLLEYLGNTVMNVEKMSWFAVKLRLYTWRKEIEEIQDASALPGKSQAEIRALKKFLDDLPQADGVILITDGLFGIMRDNRQLMAQAKAMKDRLQIVAAGYDADRRNTLKKLSDNIWLAEDLLSLMRMMAGKTGN